MHLRLVVLAAAAALTAALAGASPAAAFPCEQTLTDSLGFKWGTDENGEVISGGKAGTEDPFGNSILDVYQEFAVARGGENPLSGAIYSNGVDSNACTVGQGGQEMLYPDHPLGGSVPEVSASRRLYVPATGRAFARWIDTFRNTSNATRSYDMVLISGLGSDCGTKIGDDTSGDEFLARRDRWATTYDTSVNVDQCPNAFGTPNPDVNEGLPLAHNWDGPSLVPDRADAFPTYFDFTVPGGFLEIEYHDITLAPGQAVSYVHFASQSTTNPNNTVNARNAATGVDGEPAELFAGVSAADRARVRNWCIGDCDKDSVADANDNCKGVANPGQLNNDKDATGDACDADDDNDGRSDATELALGTNPLSPKDAAPRISKFQAPKTAKLGRKVTMSAVASDDYGVRRLTFYAGSRRLCVDRAAPYRCNWRFGGKGRRTLTAIASDAIGQVAARTRVIKVNP